MSDDRVSGLALIAGSVGFIITMALHPTGHDLFVPERFESMARLGVIAHSLALCSLPLSLLGAAGLSRRLQGGGPLPTVGLALFGLSLIAAMIAAVVSGLVAPSLIGDLLAAAPSPPGALNLILEYNGRLNQAFAKVYVAGSSLAILLWSGSMLRGGPFPRSLGWYGSILGPLILLGLFSGHLRLNVHGFGLVVLGQAAWLIAAGVLLCRPGEGKAGTAP